VRTERPALVPAMYSIAQFRRSGRSSPRAARIVETNGSALEPCLMPPLRGVRRRLPKRSFNLIKSDSRIRFRFRFASDVLVVLGCRLLLLWRLGGMRHRHARGGVPRQDLTSVDGPANGAPLRSPSRLRPELPVKAPCPAAGASPREITTSIQFKTEEQARIPGRVVINTLPAREHRATNARWRNRISRRLQATRFTPPHLMLPYNRLIWHPLFDSFTKVGRPRFPSGVGRSMVTEWGIDGVWGGASAA